MVVGPNRMPRYTGVQLPVELTIYIFDNVGQDPAYSAPLAEGSIGRDDLVQAADDGVVGVGEDGGARVGVHSR